MIPRGLRETGHLGFTRLAEALVQGRPKKLCRFTGLNHESPTMPIFVKIKPQVD